jgi:hypothetical protein
MQRVLTNDSIVLAHVQASSTSRHARGARLAPADQQAFSKDSAARAQAVTDHRAALAAGAAQVASDSSAAAPVFDPAIKAYRAYLEAYPEATDAVPGLATLFVQSGRLSEANAAFDAIYPPDRKTDPEVVIGAGRAHACRVCRQHPAAGRAVAQRLRARCARDLARLPGLRVRHLSPARLQAIDPLNRTTLRLISAGWDLRGRRDSAQKYRDLAEVGLQVEITINDFRADSAGFILEGVATNGGTTPSPVQRLTFEFLDATGHVQVTQAIEVPQLPPQGSHPIQLRVPGTALVAWRYRPS